MLHGLFRCYPGPTASSPARTRAQNQLDSQSLCFSDGMSKKFLPFLAQEIHPPPWDTHIDFEKKCPAEPGLFHRLQVGSHSFTA